MASIALDGVEQVDTQLRESWETCEETWNSKLKEEAATNEVHAQAKQTWRTPSPRLRRTELLGHR